MRLIESFIGATPAPTATCHSLNHQYRPEIDGLRAIAVLAVVFYHAGELIPGGFVGVDVFFVISGYLITKVIQSQVDEGTFSIIEFWERRIRRLMPALAVMVTFTLGLGYAFLTPPALRDLGYSSAAQVALVANIYFWRQTGYFADAAETKPLLHTWSLAVEEQFYLVLPPLLICLSLAGRRRVPLILGLAAILSLVVSIWATKAYQAAAFFLLPSRAWELLAGSLLTYLPSASTGNRWAHVGQWTGMAMIITPMLVLDRGSPFPGIAAIAPVAGTAALIWGAGASSRSALKLLLSARPFTFVGLISYSLYLWHWPVLVYIGTRWPDHGTPTVAGAIALSVLAGACSWRFVETPIRRRQLLQGRRSIFAAAGLATGALAAVSVAFGITDGVPGRFDSKLTVLIHDTDWRGLEYATPLNSANPRIVPLGVQSGPAEEARPDFLLWGDSHAMALAGAVDRVAAQEGLHGFAFVQSSHVPIPDAWMPSLGSLEVQERDRKNVIQFIQDRQPRRVIIAARWTCYLEGPSPLELEEQPGDANWYTTPASTSASRESSYKVIANGLRTLANICRQAGAQLVLLRQVPECGIASPSRDAVNFAMNRIPALPKSPYSYRDFLKRRASFDQLLEGLGALRPTIVDAAPRLESSSGRISVFQDGVSNYRDADHLSWSGLQLLHRDLAYALGLTPESAR